MNILVVGGGGREHALAWCLARSPRVSRIYVAPGNAGTARCAPLYNVDITDLNELADFAEREKVALTVVGPEAPLAAGIVNIFRKRGLRIFGPTQEAAQLESSKAFAKAFMQRHNIPTAEFATFTDLLAAKDYVRLKGAPIVIKADGLAAGKGVVVAMTEAEALAAIDSMLSHGKAGACVVIEEFLTGEEASFIVMVDGHNVVPLASSQDHKRLLAGDQGPNTGGMGAYSPAPIVTPQIHAKVMRQIISPTIQGLAAEGIQYTGFLYAGLMIDADGNVKTLEFNCRLGDPETQPILMRLHSDLLELLEKGVNRQLDTADVHWDARVALGVVMASAGYPQQPVVGAQISALPANSDDIHIFHAATREEDGKLYVNGGRVLCVTALGTNVRQAQKKANEVCLQIEWDGVQYRHDIGFHALRSIK